MNRRDAVMGLASDALWSTLARTMQLLLDPLAVFVPGVGAAVQRLGLSSNTPRYDSPARRSAGLVILLPGAEGPSLYTSWVRAGLCDLPAAIRIVNWAGFWPGVCHVINRRSARRRADRLAAMVNEYRREHPGRPVVLVGHSGGAGMAILTAERIAAAGGCGGATEPLAGVVALATPLSPGYDLRAALGGANELVVCHSRLDLLLRSLTTIGGNFDRRFGRTAGQEGFSGPGTDDPRLTPIAWDRSMMADGHWGGHIGWSHPTWVRQRLAPIVAGWLEFR